MFEKLIKYLKNNGCEVKEWDDSIVANHREKHLKIDI